MRRFVGSVFRGLFLGSGLVFVVVRFCGRVGCLVGGGFKGFGVF